MGFCDSAGMKRAILPFLLAAMTLWAEPLVVHEWGTFTVLQDEAGEAIRGINADDEPVPAFVHRATGVIQHSGPPNMRSKAVIPCHQDVRMRLETPVVYFYPAPGSQPAVDVKVSFRGGWLTEFYPRATAELPGLDDLRLAEDGIGVLEWKEMKIGGRGDGPKTEAKVWLAPRAVDADSVTMPDGERERYLFYRGVANLDAPLRVRREQAALFIEPGKDARPGEIAKRAWLADLRADGTAAFRELDLGPRTETSGLFSKTEYSRENAAALRLRLREALIADGLFPKEAVAMLDTWEESYFRSPGLRLFFLVPQAWTDRHMPLTLSVPARVSRAMVGRIEIVTPDQRRYLGILSEKKEFDRGDVPAAYYLLGRFANALIIDELRRRPTPGLKQLTQTYRIASFPPAEKDSQVTARVPVARP